MSIDSVKNKLCFHTGTAPSAMLLWLRSSRGGSSVPLDASRMLGYYSPQDGCVGVEGVRWLCN